MDSKCGTAGMTKQGTLPSRGSQEIQDNGAVGPPGRKSIAEEDGGEDEGTEDEGEEETETEKSTFPVPSLLR